MPPRVYFGLKLIIFVRKITDDCKPYKRKNIRAVFNSCFCFECRLPMMEDLDYLGPDDDRIDHNSAITDEEFIKLRTSLLVNCVLNAIFSLIAAAGNGVILLVIWKTSSLHTPSNSLLFGLALTDFFVGLLTQPLYLATRLVYVVTRVVRGVFLDSNSYQHREVPGIPFAHEISCYSHYQESYSRHRCRLVVIVCMGLHVDVQPPSVLLFRIFSNHCLFNCLSSDVLENLSDCKTSPSANHGTKSLGCSTPLKGYIPFVFLAVETISSEHVLHLHLDFSFIFSMVLHSRCHSSNRTQSYQTNCSRIYWLNYIHKFLA